MANSTTNIDTVIQSQASKEVTINAYLDASSPATLYGRRASASTGLTWAYYGGNATLSSGSMSQIANGTLALTASATCYIVALKSSGAVSFSTSSTNWNDATNYWRLYSVVTGTATVTSYTDSRELGKMTGGGGGTGSAITAKDEGSTLTTGLTSLDFVGAGVSATNSSGAVTVTITGAGNDLTLNTQTDSYTLVAGDSGKYVRMNKSTANNLTVPLNSSVAFATGTQIHIRQVGAGKTTIVATGGVTITTPETLNLRKQHSTATLVKVGTDSWELIGDLESA